jgi:hypothetical protein
VTALGPFFVVALVLLWFTDEPVAAIFAGVVAEALVGIALGRLSNSKPRVATAIVRGAARLLPAPERARYETEWIDHVKSESDGLAALGAAVSIAALAAPGLAVGSRVGRAPALIAPVSAIDDAVIRRLATDPDLIDDLSPALLDDLMSHLYARQGFDVSSVPASSEGAVDLHVLGQTPAGRTLTLVTTKCYRPGSRVGVGAVRHLYAELLMRNASAAVIVTTSSFTKGAREFQAQIPFRISLCDRGELQRMLEQAARDL